MVGDVYTQAAGGVQASPLYQKADRRRLSIQKEVFRMSPDPSFAPVINVAD
jgi:hypothetical protein